MRYSHSVTPVPQRTRKKGDTNGISMRLNKKLYNPEFELENISMIYKVKQIIFPSSVH